MSTNLVLVMDKEEKSVPKNFEKTIVPIIKINGKGTTRKQLVSVRKFLDFDIKGFINWLKIQVINKYGTKLSEDREEEFKKSLDSLKIENEKTFGKHNTNFISFKTKFLGAIRSSGVISLNDKSKDIKFIYKKE